MCWMGACKILEMEQQAVERMGEEWQGKFKTSYGMDYRMEASFFQEDRCKIETTEGR